MYLGMVPEILGKGKGAVSDAGGVKNIIGRVFEATKDSINRTAGVFRAGATVLKEEPLLTRATAILAKRGIDSTKLGSKYALNGTLRTLKTLSGVTKGFIATEIVSQMAQLIPLYFESLAIKSAGDNDTIIIHPLILRDAPMMQGLEGYRSNDLWMHAKDMIINAKRTINTAFEDLNSYYEDIKFGTLPNNMNKGIVDGPSTFGKKGVFKNWYNPDLKDVTDDQLSLVNKTNALDYIRERIQDKNKHFIQPEQLDKVMKALEDENKNQIPWELVAAVMDCESGFDLQAINCKPPATSCALGVFQTITSIHKTNLIAGARKYNPEIAGLSNDSIIERIRRNTGAYPEANIYAAMPYLSLCYDNAKYSFSKLKAIDISEGRNKKTAMYTAAYAKYHGGPNTKFTIRKEEGVLNTDISIIVTNANGEELPVQQSLPRFNQKLAMAVAGANAKVVKADLSKHILLGPV
jgi:hypothetical protein